MINAFPGSNPDNILFAGSLIAASTLAQTTLTLTFPGPISTTAGGVQIVGASGVFSTVSLASLQSSVIDVTLPGTDAINTSSGSFRIQGFQLPACGPISLAVNPVTNNYILATSTINQPPPLVITSVNISKGIVYIHGTGNFCSPSVYLGETRLTGVVPCKLAG